MNDSDFLTTKDDDSIEGRFEERIEGRLKIQSVIWYKRDDDRAPVAIWSRCIEGIKSSLNMFVITSK